MVRWLRWLIIDIFEGKANDARNQEKKILWIKSSTKCPRTTNIHNPGSSFLFFSWNFPTENKNPIANSIKTAQKHPESCWSTDPTQFHQYYWFAIDFARYSPSWRHKMDNSTQRGFLSIAPQDIIIWSYHFLINTILFVFFIKIRLRESW